MKKTIFVIFLVCSFSVISFGQTNKLYDTPLKIIHKPKAAWTDGQDCSTGTITLRVEFLETGEIGKISLVSGLTKSKNEASIEATKKIKFKPAMKNGKPITVTKQVQYNFSLY